MILMSFSSVRISSFLVRLIEFKGFSVLFRAGIITTFGRTILFTYHAGVAELVDARDSKSRGLGRVGSSPTSGTLSPAGHAFAGLFLV